MLNPFAVVFWVLCAGIGFLVGDMRGAVMGAVVGMACSFVIALWDEIR